MIKKLRSLLVLALICLISTSCAQRRLAKLQTKRAMRSYDEDGIILSDGSFYPDKITDFSVDEYLKWYKNLSTPLKLQLPSYSKAKTLTKEERVEDFNYLFNELKNNYPFFGVLKREDKIDFLKNYDKYLRKVEACKDDEEFKIVLDEIMADLKNNHARIADKEYVEATMRYFSKNWKSPSIYYEFLNLNRQVVRNRYSLAGMQSDTDDNFQKDRRKSLFAEDSSRNLTLEEVGDDMALLRINQMACTEK